MPGLHYVRGEIERMRRQILRQRKEIQDLPRAGIPAKAAEELLERMLACARSATASAKSRGSNNTDQAINGPIERRFR